ncbi:alpha,alpha-phosphotrehalase [Clostridium botulinum 202F]|nr:alpha,alpha-phosphotrehalase [Clostridium botulinum 202F]KAI3344694.1 alpha,alpha-phosphotrehalase [Clostridium botulinum]KON12057.1 trehalose-6-phosphate hydrolase [Clostridium botulinum]MBY6985119.1 alpha,alpha-phosphotrehalase [Clostridium botulinum]NFH01144.1 alpha,alpha-phosphotrehalase [Clostridium botulinum]
MKDFKKSTVYQIYPKSFNDSNGDGIGDLNGVINKLDYLEELGIDYIWLTPFYVSPQNDNGYDVADYYNIDPLFGTNEDFDRLVKEAEKRNIHIMLDMVFNHTSTEHQWFKNALHGDGKFKDFYIFKKGKNGNPPTNWQSKFGGNAWEYIDKFDEYYLRLFDKTQGDLDWTNSDVKNEIYKIVNHWINKGVKGFRFDVINLISKPEKFEDDAIGDGRRFYTDGPNIHKYLKELNENTFGKYDDIITVGEMSSTTIDNCVKYSNSNEKELSMVFNFHHLKVDYDNGDKWTLMNFDFKLLKSIFKEWQEGMEQGNGWNAVFWCNHDQPRIISRFGNTDKYHKESGKMLGTCIHMMRGTPYIYQGEEFGMTNPNFNSIDEYRDIESKNYYDILKENHVEEEEIYKILASKSRDNSRTPMQWNDEKNSGFSNNEPWIPVGKYYKEINAKNALKDSDSIFYHYKKLIGIRKEYDVVSNGSFNMILEEHEKVLAYTREYNNEKLIVLNNFYDEEAEILLPHDLLCGNGRILISNYKDSMDLNDKILLRPYESIVYIVEN